jgi:RHS repeat-associated protein
VVEEDLSGLVATTDFVYDTRGRLVIERRSANDGTGYRFDYTYDLGGNRLTKVGDGKRTVYHYDIHDPCRYESNNNRLEYYEVWDEVPEPDELVSTTYYYYTGKGNVERVVTEYENEPGAYYGVRMAYAANGQALTHAIGETWTGNSCPMQNWEVQYVREFRYDAARQRYLNIEHDPVNYRDVVQAGSGNPFIPLTRTWTDYDGDEPYGDFQIAQSGQLTNMRSFELGTGFADPWTGGGGSGGANSKYYHADLIGTTRLLSDASGSAATSSATVFTAFGERISGANPTAATRYGYAGEWGYQTHADFPFLHVGHRYYDPSTGRFMQRDPIGIRGGLNVYEYVEGTPTIAVDPEGESWLTPNLNRGKLRVGRSMQRINARRAVARFALRYKGYHMYGIRGALGTGGLVCIAAGVGAGTGIAINYGIPKIVKTQKDRLTDYPVDWIFGKLTGQCPGC